MSPSPLRTASQSVLPPENSQHVSDLVADFFGGEFADPLVLALRLDHRPLHGLTGRVDWRLGGRLSALCRQGLVPIRGPLLLPPFDVLPCGRILCWRVGSITPVEMARAIANMGFGTPGLCPADFGFHRHEVQNAFGGNVLIYGDR